MGRPIVHFEIMGKDAVRLQKFYAELFDWKIGEPAAEMGYYGLVDAGSSGLPGGIGQDPSGTPRVTVDGTVLPEDRLTPSSRNGASTVCLETELTAHTMVAVD